LDRFARNRIDAYSSTIEESEPVKTMDVAPYIKEYSSTIEESELFILLSAFLCGVPSQARIISPVKVRSG